MRVEFPWPPKELSPNRRDHWSKRQRAAKWAREYAWYATTKAGGRPTKATKFKKSITFYPPNRRRVDEDNLRIRCKSFVDGIADVLGVDDTLFRGVEIHWGEIVPGGKVEINIEEQPND